MFVLIILVHKHIKFKSIEICCTLIIFGSDIAQCFVPTNRVNFLYTYKQGQNDKTKSGQFLSDVVYILFG